MMESPEVEVFNKKPRSKPKVTKEWTEEEIFNLISLVETEKSLWDARDSAYHNKTMRDSAWRSIVENFNFKYQAADLNAKWTNLRIQFRGYASRAQTKSGQGNVDVPKWRYFNAMRFVGRAEDQQTQATVSNLLYEVESDCNSFEQDFPATPESTTKRQKLGRQQQAANTNSAATAIAETMKEALTVMKEGKNSSNNPNAMLYK